ncbi:hypothetical protein B4U80_14446, partial [Leptotrombidium deliense]
MANGDEKQLVAIVVNGEEIIACKQLLIENSEYFRAMFELPLKESRETRIVLNDFDCNAFKSIVPIDCNDCFELLE